MRLLTALFCLVAAASADKLGYNYQPVGHSGSGLSFLPGGAASNPAPAISEPAEPSRYQPGNTAEASRYQPSAPIAAPSAAEPEYAAQPELQKEFFTYTADESAFDEPDAAQQSVSDLKKSLRVIFIKGPASSGLEQGALQLAKQASQQETAIYVLSKQADIGDLANKLNSINDNKSNKPEVHFVKYRTPEDAANAQRAIQGQYDQLGGASSHHDGGVAPSLNFASSAPAPIAAPAPNSSYLPASVLRLFRL
ncbi:uncharacterized protein LOC115620363 [Scaptodrosophila lebanonensis]|uniref:Uncharacterized protein LOC115620363 n=1 Tax=Drosophila lebanonensis TaxID=7225 RepID=A0A6J2T3G4_DROLE|nr:uncharacterized protein LOC115620363 [Scaptodrosophila lebanonensis]